MVYPIQIAEKIFYPILAVVGVPVNLLGIAILCRGNLMTLYYKLLFLEQIRQYPLSAWTSVQCEQETPGLSQPLQERERDRQTDRMRERDTERDREAAAESQRARERDCKKKRLRERYTD
ncbi:hypothetical protein scyTo_0017329 [Scyliorhinus torazame]|uniref:Uncharacterized protein n=1 Tax=Scyliorhinus torazame TaxID=75743 RepID=A0A401PQE2_SCYTO|nr:hypothetical protein [Scyliorhinus torazame]